ncbi:AraC family transcriptional regulator [Mesobacillus subterraneus]|uniref:AraC family transcriptional regulator n=1 Tax=Mesobacillus subterraneus TaxID=285983 RepID=A0A3R9DTA0_9BACI|nr:AraC family transcriptional regulator [Mesobacillus subterraneus]RSD26881.1 AraC family transcriptional regulator [Mesobacillus subterraneus]
MAWIEALQRAIDYMEEHLLEDITIEEIARVANSSPFHFQRTFSILTDSSVSEYMRRRRLTLAAHELGSTDVKIIDLALKYGYDTPEAFTKAFRRQHGISPSEARKFAGKLNSYGRLGIQVSLKGVEPMQYRVVELEAFEVIGVKESFSYANGENTAGIPKMWGKANHDGTSDFLLCNNNGTVKGLLGVCVDQSKVKEKQMDYWVAAACDGETPDGYSKMEIPASRWAIFEVHGPMPDAIQKVWKQIFTEWFPANGYQHAGTPDLEVYTAGNPTDPDYYSEVWIPVK